MQIIGLTGGIATGKSTASRYLSEELGLPVVDADLIARQVVEPGKPAYKCIDCIDPQTGQIDRTALGQRVFSDQANRRRLDRCTHPQIRREIARQMLRHWLAGQPIVVLDAPLLYEASLDAFMDRCAVVNCDEHVQLQRLLARNQELSEEQAIQRVQAQLPTHIKAQWADWVWQNNGTREDLCRQIHADVTPQLVHRTAWLRWLLWIIWPVRILLWTPWRYLIAKWQRRRRTARRE